MYRLTTRKTTMAIPTTVPKTTTTPMIRPLYPRPPLLRSLLPPRLRLPPRKAHRRIIPMGIPTMNPKTPRLRFPMTMRPGMGIPMMTETTQMMTMIMTATMITMMMTTMTTDNNDG